MRWECVLVLLAIVAPWPSYADERTEAIKLTKHLWDSLDNVSFRYEEYNLNPDGSPNLTPGMTRIDYSFAAGGRRAYRMAIVKGGLEAGSEQWFQDGKNRYVFTFLEKNPQVIDLIRVLKQPDTHEDNRNAMSPPLWFLTPAGIPIYQHLISGAELGKCTDPDYQACMLLVIKRRSTLIRYTVDPSKDWLARRVRVGDFSEYTATRFCKNQGRWFPCEGQIIKDKNGAKPVSVGFRVSNLSLNRPSSIDPYKLPKLEEGTIINDPHAHKTKIIGGELGRSKFEQKYGLNLDETEQGEPMAAESNPPASWWPLITAALSIALIASGLFLKRSHKN